MKKMLWVVAAFTLLYGCATTKISNLATDNRMNLVRLSLGMSKEKALDIMGSRSAEYICDVESSGPGAKMKLSNPYRAETFQVAGKILEVVYYITDLKHDNCKIDNEELTPLVFEDSKLIGWGNNFLPEVIPAVKPQQQPPQQQSVANVTTDVESKTEEAKVTPSTTAEKPGQQPQDQPVKASAVTDVKPESEKAATITPTAADKTESAKQLPDEVGT
ncbi:DUF3192 domain-containing protein [bacterium]|nr:MAG: DUF3192 domain-containing protein [bacterium]